LVRSIVNITKEKWWKMQQVKRNEILVLSEEVTRKFEELIQSTRRPDLAIRVIRQDYQTQLMFAAPEDRKKDDVVQNVGGFDIIFDPETATLLQDATLDVVDNSFQITPAPGKNLYPTTKEWGEPVADAIQNTIDQQLNPGLASHGGWVKLLEVAGDTAYIEMGGGCRGCMHSYITLKSVIENTIKEKVPSIRNVIDTTDHAGGTNPYYSPESQD
jgi:Fe/S biogenesis protein NfuA